MFELTPEHLQSRKIGLERETLRTHQDAPELAAGHHPAALGSALTHPSITVDYAEQMLEFVTGPHGDTAAAYQELLETTAWVAQTIDQAGEMLWSYSMPPRLSDPDRIIPAFDQPSGAAQFKYFYRVGLAHRYGREMQLISGMHFNYSLSDETIRALANFHGYPTDTEQSARNAVYLGAIRNITRHGWLISYLLGASPMSDPDFIRAVQSANELEISDQYEYQFATSLRMSDIGYTNKRRCRWQAELNDFDKFIDSIAVGLAEQCSIFSKIGTFDADGHRQQLSDKILQIENEFYSIARPKAISRDGEPPLVALARYGVEYLEFRMTDIDPTQANGVSPEALTLLEVFILYCLVSPSPHLGEREREMADANRLIIANQGRDNPHLSWPDGDKASHTHAHELLEQMLPIAAILDQAGTGHEHLATEVIKAYQASITSNQRYAHQIAEMTNTKHNGDIVQYAQSLAQQHHRALLNVPLSQDYQSRQAAIADTSLAKNTSIEQSGDDFPRYYDRYQAQLQSLFEARKIPILTE